MDINTNEARFLLWLGIASIVHDRRDHRGRFVKNQEILVPGIPRDCGFHVWKDDAGNYYWGFDQQWFRGTELDTADEREERKRVAKELARQINGRAHQRGYRYKLYSGPREAFFRLSR